MWKLKLDENGNVVLRDGKPVYVRDDGTEFVADVPSMHSKITELSQNVETQRRRAQSVEEKFEGIDPDAAKAALAKVKDFGDSEMIKKGELDQLKAQMTEGYEAKLRERDERIEKLTGINRDAALRNAFASSKFIADNVVVPLDMVVSTFGGRFKVDPETGAVYSETKDGHRLMSTENPGEPAKFDEALKIIVDGYEHRDHILKAKGSDKPRADLNGKSADGKPIYTKTQLDGMDQMTRASAKMKIAKGEAIMSAD